MPAMDEGVVHAEEPAGAEHRAAEQLVVDLVESGRLADANALFDQVITRVPPDDDRTDRAAAMIHRAVVAWRLGRIPLALELAAEGWTELESGEVHGPRAAQAIGMLGYLLEAIGRRATAVELHRRSVGVARDGGDPSVLAHCLQRLGGSLNSLASEVDAHSAAAVYAEARDALAEGRMFSPTPRVDRALRLALARAQAGLGELDRAEELASGALADAQAAGSRWATGVAYWVLGTAALARGNVARAHELLTRSLAEVEQIQDAALMQRIGLDLAAVSRRRGDAAAEAQALRALLTAAHKSVDTMQEGLGQALEQRRLAVQAQRLAVAAQQAAARDPLTGLANRFGFEQSAGDVLAAAAARGEVVWLVIVDVDHFKRVNDEAGHPAGDAVLREVARLLRRECRAGDLVARWAGDEFVVLLTDIPERPGEAGPIAAERIRAAAARHRWSVMLGIGSGPTVSIGVARGPGDLESLFADADAALYRAKRSGRNRVEVNRADQ